jgi:alcohol dehydrogenase class IV
MGASTDLGAAARELGARAAVVTSGRGADWAREIHTALRDQLDRAGVQIVGEPIRGARPNSPLEDVERIRGQLDRMQWDVLVAVGGGSGIDAAKAALAQLALPEEPLAHLLGTGRLSAKLEQSGQARSPLLAVQLASGSASHLTRYANCTEVEASQKYLIVDDALVPDRAVFDYAWTRSMSPDFTMDGALDGIAHCWEVFMGASGERLDTCREICLTGIDLILSGLVDAVGDGDDLQARRALGLGTDLGGYAIMLGGTNGAHLNSFSLVDLLAHGRACAVMNPYWTVLFAEAIQPQLRCVAEIYRKHGWMHCDPRGLAGRDLAVAVAEAMLELSRRIGYPTCLGEVEGFEKAHADRALSAAKDPKLRMKLANMPIPMEPGQIDSWMGSVLEAATQGDLRKVAQP